MLAMKLCPWKFLLCLSLTALSIFYHHNKLPLATTLLQPMVHGLAMDLLLSSFTMALSLTLPMMLKVIYQCVGLLQDVTNLMLFVVPLLVQHLSLLYRLLPIYLNPNAISCNIIIVLVMLVFINFKSGLINKNVALTPVSTVCNYCVQCVVVIAPLIMGKSSGSVKGK